MALVRRGSRRIVVDGTVYRWRLRGRPAYFQGLAWSPCTFAVEHADTPGTTLVVTTSRIRATGSVARLSLCGRPVLLRLFGLRCVDSDGSGLRVPPRPIRRLLALTLNSRGIVHGRWCAAPFA
jgi:hypothetical protein